MPRGIRLLGWLFIGVGVGATACLLLATGEGWKAEIGDSLELWIKRGWLMGLTFGVLQLAYGIYLYFTEKEKNAA
jgi:hypothetical protein